MSCKTTLIAASLFAAAAPSCSNDASQADHAAKQLVGETEKLRVAQTRVDEGGSPDTARVAEHEDDVERAADLFAVRRSARVAALEATHAVIATQPPLVHTMAAALPLTDPGRADVMEKLTIFEMRLAETARAIETLQNVPASEFTSRDDAVTKAMTRLEAARIDAWKVITHAPRLDRTSSL